MEDLTREMSLGWDTMSRVAVLYAVCPSKLSLFYSTFRRSAKQHRKGGKFRGAKSVTCLPSSHLLI